MQKRHTCAAIPLLQALARRGVLSAPIVMVPALEDDFGGGVFLEQENTMVAVLVGWADLKDVVSAFLEHLHEHHPELPSSMLSLMTLLDKESHKYVSRMLITLHSSEDRGLVYKANSNTTLLETIR